MFLEPPAKRLRLAGNEPVNHGDDDDDDSEFDELLYEPHEVTEMRDPDYKLTKRRVAANNRFQSAMEGIIARFDRDFGDTGDEISFATGELVVNRGHISSLQAWGREDRDGEEGDEEEDDEEGGIRLEDLPDEWGQDDLVGEATTKGMESVIAQDPAALSSSEDEGVSMEDPPPEQHAMRRMEVLIPLHRSLSSEDYKLPGLAGYVEHTEGELALPYISQEEYDSGFGSGSSEFRRSGRVRKQVDYLGKISWAEALEQNKEQIDIAPYSPTPSLRDASPSSDEHRAPAAPGTLGHKLDGILPLDMNVMIPDSQPALTPSSPPVLAHTPLVEQSTKPQELPYSHSLEDLQFIVVPDSEDEDLEDDIAAPETTKPVIDERPESNRLDERHEARQDMTTQEEDAPLNTSEDGESYGISRIHEVPDSQEPTSSDIQMADDIQATTDAQDAHDKAVSQTQVKTGTYLPEPPPQIIDSISFEDWIRAVSPVENEPPTPTRKPHQPILQQITPRPSPQKPSTPSSKPRSSPAHPRTPRGSSIRVSKAPSSRRSILSLVSDKKADGGRRSDDEDELLRDADYAVTVAKLFDSSRKRRRHRADVFRTPVKQQRTERLMTPLSGGRLCGQGDLKCGSSFCFTCM